MLQAQFFSYLQPLFTHFFSIAFLIDETQENAIFFAWMLNSSNLIDWDLRFSIGHDVRYDHDPSLILVSIFIEVDSPHSNELITGT